jgi:hypothetical protein
MLRKAEYIAMLDGHPRWWGLARRDKIDDPDVATAVAEGYVQKSPEGFYLTDKGRDHAIILRDSL